MKNLLKSPPVLVILAFIIGISISSTSQIVNGDYGFFEGLWPVIVGASFFMIVGAYGNAIYDAKMIKDGKYVDHPMRFITRAIAAILFSLIVMRDFTIDSGMLVVYQGFLFWLVFDPMLSIKRGREWDYLSKWYGTSWMDKVFKGNTVLWMTTKTFLFIASLMYFILQ